MSNSSVTLRPQRERLAAALLEQSRRLGSSEHLDLLTWAIRRRPFLKVGVSFNLTSHLYLADIYRTEAEEKVIYKASQMGASEYGVSYVLHAADERKATCLYIFPTESHVSDFSTARIGPAIEASSYLNALIADAQEGGDGPRRRKADRVTLKRVGDRFLYLRGGQVKPNGQAPQLKSIDADIVVYDEVDEMDPRAPAIGAKRLGHSAIHEQLYISTPTYPGVGIHAKWLESDQREWMIRCQGCGERQPLTIGHIVTEWDSLGRPVSWHEKDGRVFAACQKCGRELDRLSAGEWVATYPQRKMAGFHLTKLFSSTVDLANVVQALNTADETKRREAFNQDLGETYTPRGGQITSTHLDSLRRDYGHGPVKGERTVMGVDVGRVLHVVIRGPQQGDKGERPQRFAGEVDGFDALGRLFRDYNVGTCVIDALPETRMAREFQTAHRGKVWLAYYVSQKTGTKRADPAQWDSDQGVVNLDRTRMLDLTYSRFYEEVNTLPAHARDVRDYYSHLTALVRVIEEGPNGERVAQYIESGPDHLAHAENYCTVASEGGSAFANIMDYYRRRAEELNNAKNTGRN